MISYEKKVAKSANLGSITSRCSGKWARTHGRRWKSSLVQIMLAVVYSENRLKLFS